MNGGSATVDIDGGGTVTPVVVADGNDTPAGIVAAINASTLDITASLLTVDTNESE